MFVAKNKTQLRMHNVVHFMHPNTRSHNGYLPATESRETTQKLSFGAKEVDWACSLRKTRCNFGSIKWCIVCTPKPDLTTYTSRQRNRAIPPRNLVLGLNKWIGHVRCEKTRRNFGSTKWCIVCTPKPDLTTCTSRLRNRTKPPKNLVWPNEVDWACLLRKNKTQLWKQKVVHCMHPKTRSHNGYLPATESRETTQKLSFGPNEVDWACSLRKNKTQLRMHKVVHFMHPKTRSHNGYLPAMESCETTQKLSFGPKEVDWASLLRKNKTQLWKHKAVHFMHPETRSHNLYLPATKSCETTQKLSFGPQEMDWACSLRKNKTQLWKHKVVHCMHPKTRCNNGYLPATKSCETTQKLSFGPKEVDWACLLRKNKTQLRKHKAVHFTHPETRSHNLYLPATKSRETTQKLSFVPQEMDWACLLRKNKTQLRKHKVVHCMPQNPISQRLPPGNGNGGNHPKI